MNKCGLKIFISCIFGFVVGIAAGIVGVGGGEFRLPVLLYILKLPLKVSIAGNLLIGFFTVCVSAIFRLCHHLIKIENLWLILFMSLGSVIGGYIGAVLVKKINVVLLKYLLTIFLFFVGLNLILGTTLTFLIITNSLYLTFWQQNVLSVFLGFIIGVISGMFGVAGGEFRIPVLKYVFGLDIKTAGTVSLIVSIPTIFSGFFKHLQFGHLKEKENFIVCISMAIMSAVGSYFGARYASMLKKEEIEFILGLILIFATIRMVTKP